VATPDVPSLHTRDGVMFIIYKVAPQVSRVEGNLVTNTR